MVQYRRFRSVSESKCHMSFPVTSFLNSLKFHSFNSLYNNKSSVIKCQVFVTSSSFHMSVQRIYADTMTSTAIQNNPEHLPQTTAVICCNVDVRSFIQRLLEGKEFS